MNCLLLLFILSSFIQRLPDPIRTEAAHRCAATALSSQRLKLPRPPRRRNAPMGQNVVTASVDAPQTLFNPDRAKNVPTTKRKGPNTQPSRYDPHNPEQFFGPPVPFEANTQPMIPTASRITKEEGYTTASIFETDDDPPFFERNSPSPPLADFNMDIDSDIYIVSNLTRRLLG